MSLAVDRAAAAALLEQWLAARLTDEALGTLNDKRAAIASGGPKRALFVAFSAVPRWTGKADLALTAGELDAAGRACEGWDPSRWSVDQAGRALLVLTFLGIAPVDDATANDAPADALPPLDVLDALFNAADVGEAVALYQALPLMPHAEALVARASEGVRANMTAVFEAVALRNPYPAAYLGEGAWNQMVLKAFFVGARAGRIVGVDRRANPTLARMLVDYAHERWAAGRRVDPELWRCVGRFASKPSSKPAITAVLGELTTRVLSSDDPLEAQAGALALWDSGDEATRESVREARAGLASALAAGTLTWRALTESIDANVG